MYKNPLTHALIYAIIFLGGCPKSGAFFFFRDLSINALIISAHGILYKSIGRYSLLSNALILFILKKQLDVTVKQICDT